MPSFEQKISTNLDRLEAALDDLQTQRIQAVNEVTIHVERLKHTSGQGDTTPEGNGKVGDRNGTNRWVLSTDEGVAGRTVTRTKEYGGAHNGFDRDLPIALSTSTGPQETVQGCPEEERPDGCLRLGDEGGEGTADGLLSGVHHRCNEPYSPDTVRLQSKFEDPSRRVASTANLFLTLFVLAAIFMLVGSSLRFLIR